MSNRPAARRWPMRIVRILLVVVALGIVVALGGGLWLHGKLRSSLALLERRRVVEGLSETLTIDRDALGVPTIRGASRNDVAWGTGFVHAQERFFQMDLLRRKAAGELAALLGPVLLPTDRAARNHRLRHAAERNIEQAGEETRALLEAYTEGINAGLAALGARPPEYLALRCDPEPWSPQDTTLVVLAMYLELQDHEARRESAMGLMRDLLPEALVSFLTPLGSEWDAPIVGPPLVTPPIPPAEVFDLRRSEPPPESRRPAAAFETDELPVASDTTGSNSWAVDGRLTADGRAIVANDMHLSLAVPNTWFRASLVWSDSGIEHQVTGATLPGAPLVIAGSNGHVAWGFTNSYGDWSDLIVLENDAGDEEIYRTPDGPRRIERIEERIRVRGAEDEAHEVPWTIWGPVHDTDHRGRWRVLRWVAHDLQAVDMRLARMERARTVKQALEIAARTGIPTQNVVVADREGRVGWTLMGPIPRRVGFDGRWPETWGSGTSRWDGYLEPHEYPFILDPPGGRVWTANNRVVGGRMLDRIGDGGYVSGARATQIRNGLLALNQASETDMLALQLDDRALFLERWRELLLRTLTSEAIADDPRRGELRGVVRDDWSGRASVDSAGYRMVRAFRLFLAEQVFEAITGACSAADERFDYQRVGRWEGPLWRLVTERPLHLLDPRFERWEDQLLAGVDRVLEYFLDDEDDQLEQRTWGERNTVRIRHPISLAVPQLSRWLDMAPIQLPGDALMPRVQGPRFGASQRMVVAPGREDRGIFHMPGGQSGHPMSPFYRKGHEAWARGEPTPFNPGPPLHRLTLQPGP